MGNTSYDNAKSYLDKRKYLLKLKQKIYKENIEDYNELDNEIRTIYVLIGSINSGKSQLSEVLAVQNDAIPSKVRPVGNYDDTSFYIYKYGAGNSFIVDTGGGISRQPETYLNNSLSNDIKTTLLNDKENYNVDENDEFVFVYILLTIGASMGQEDKAIIKALIKNKQKWLFCFSQFWKGKTKDRKQEMETKERYLADKFKLLSADEQKLILSKTYFIATDKNENKFELNALKERLKYIRWENDEYINILNEMKAVEIKIGIFGKNDVGKSKLTNNLVGSNKALVQDGVTQQGMRMYEHSKYRNVSIFDHPGYGEQFSCDLASIDKSYDLIVLVLKDGQLVEKDKEFIRNINEKSKLFIVHTGLDTEKTVQDSPTLNNFKENLKTSFNAFLQVDMDELKNFYCVSLDENYIKEKKVNELDEFLFDWFDKGLDVEQKHNCTCFSKNMTTSLIYDIRMKMSSFSIQNIAGSVGCLALNMLPVTGDIFDWYMLRDFIETYSLTLRLRALNEYDKSVTTQYKYLESGFNNYESSEIASDIEKLKKIKEKYWTFESAYINVYNEALDRFIEYMPQLRLYFEMKKKSIAITAAKVTASTCKATIGLLAGLSDDLLRALPKIAPVIGSVGAKVTGAAGIAVSVLISAFSLFYSIKMIEFIKEILVNDALFLYGNEKLEKINLIVFLGHKESESDKLNYIGNNFSYLKNDVVISEVHLPTAQFNKLCRYYNNEVYNSVVFDCQYNIFDGEQTENINFESLEEVLINALPKELKDRKINDIKKHCTVHYVLKIADDELIKYYSNAIHYLIEKQKCWYLVKSKFDTCAHENSEKFKTLVYNTFPSHPEDFLANHIYFSHDASDKKWQGMTRTFTDDIYSGKLQNKK